MTVSFENELGETLLRVGDYNAAYAHLLPSIYDDAFWYINRIDQYGDTIFNQLQAPRLLLEWDQFSKVATTPRMVQTMAEIRGLIVRLSNEQHHYVRFRGE